MSEKKKPYNYALEIKDLSTLEENNIKVSVETLTGFKNAIKINIDKSLINSNLIDKDEEILFLLLIKYNHPISPPFYIVLQNFQFLNYHMGEIYWKKY